MLQLFEHERRCARAAWRNRNISALRVLDLDTVPLPFQHSLDRLPLLDILESLRIVLAIIDGHGLLYWEVTLLLLFDKVWNELQRSACIRYHKLDSPSRAHYHPQYTQHIPCQKAND